MRALQVCKLLRCGALAFAGIFLLSLAGCVPVRTRDTITTPNPSYDYGSRSKHLANEWREWQKEHGATAPPLDDTPQHHYSSSPPPYSPQGNNPYMTPQPWVPPDAEEGGYYEGYSPYMAYPKYAPEVDNPYSPYGNSYGGYSYPSDNDEQYELPPGAIEDSTDFPLYFDN